MAKNEKQGIAAASGEPEVEKKEGAKKAVGDRKEAAEATSSKYDVRFSLFPAEGPVKGVCSVTIGGEFAVKNVKLVEGSHGLFVAMPSYKAGDEYKDLFFPVTKEARQSLHEAVMAEYEKQLQIHKYDANFGMQPAPEAAQPAMAPAMA